MSTLLGGVLFPLALRVHAQPAPSASEDAGTISSDAGGAAADAATIEQAVPAPPQTQPPNAAAGPELGQLRVLLTGPEARPLTRSVVRVGSTEGTVDEQAVAALSVPEGTHTVELMVPKDVLPEAATTNSTWRIALSDVAVVAGQLTEVLVTLGATGSLANLEVRGAGAPPAEPETAPEAESATADEGRGPGKVRGTIIAAEDGEEVDDAHIYVAGSSFEALSDRDGKFTLELPAGIYQLAIVHADFATHTIPNFRVRPNKIATLNVPLQPPGGFDEWVVSAPRIQGGVATVLQERRKAATMTDAVGAEDIRRSPDSTASTATRRVVGASVVGGQFLFVRGLGGRYTNVRLNGVPLPSTDPDLPGFQIDLFPSSLLSSLTIAKTFSPDIPGDFAGGSLNVETDTFPDKFKLNISFGARYNTQSTFEQSPTYHGGKTDALGYDDGTRAMPEGVPDERVDVARRGQEGLTRDEVNAVGKLFPNHWRMSRTRTLPSMSAGLSVGDTVKLAGRKLGYLATAGYRLNYLRYDESVLNLIIPEPGRVGVRDTYKRELGKTEAQIGALGTVSYELAQGHTIRAVSLLTQTSEDNTSVVGGTSDDRNVPIAYRQFQFIQRQLLFNQLMGKHVDLLGPLQLDWQLNASRVRRDQPDTRDVLYEQIEGAFEYSPSSPVSGQHLYTDLDQRDFGGGLDLTLPVKKVTTKAGYLGRFSERGFSARRFKPQLDPGAPREVRVLPPEELFVPESYGDWFEFREVTRPDDGYQSEERLNAGYAMGDLDALKWLRLMAGLRLEAFYQGIDVSTPYATTAPESAGTSRHDIDLLPAGSAIVRLTEEMNLRFAYGMTVARPLARELAPFLSQDFVRRRNTQGNPDLKRTSIHNIDARWEYFPTTSEVFAASVFYKVFRDPIERVILNTAGDGSFQNIHEATSYGAELEARLSLGRMADVLGDFTIGGNLALIKSEVSLTAEERAKATSDKRPLGGQSPYVVNLSLGWSPERFGVSAFIYYNVYGRRIDEVGFEGLPDVYEQPFHSLDLTAFYDLGAGFNVGASAVNLLGQSLVFKQADFDVSRSYRGRDFGLRLSWTY